MPYSQFIETGIGLVFIYCLTSIMISGIHELFVAILAERGKQMKNALYVALNDPLNKICVERIYNHPLVVTLKEHEGRFLIKN